MSTAHQTPRSRRQRRKRLKLLISRNARRHAAMIVRYGADNLNVQGVAGIVDALRDELAEC